MLASEILGELAPIEFVEMLAGVGQFVGTRQCERVVGDVDNAFERRHLGGIHLSADDVADEEDFRLTVVDDVVYLFGGKLMQYWHSHGTIGECGEECHSPMGGVASAECNLVAPLHTRVLEHDMQFLYLACHIVVLQGNAFIISQGIEVPIVYNAFFNYLVE